MSGTLWIPGQLPGMNEMLDAAKSGRGKGNAYSRMKYAWTQTVALWARKERLGAFASPVSVTCLWCEPDARRDPDNVQAGVKLVLDGLVEAGVIKGDGRKHIAKVAHVVKTAPKGAQVGVYVTIDSA